MVSGSARNSGPHLPELVQRHRNRQLQTGLVEDDDSQVDDLDEEAVADAEATGGRLKSEALVGVYPSPGGALVQVVDPIEREHVRGSANREEVGGSVRGESFRILCGFFERTRGSSSLRGEE
jgi:hypothetical protein